MDDSCPPAFDKCVRVVFFIVMQSCLNNFRLVSEISGMMLNPAGVEKIFERGAFKNFPAADGTTATPQIVGKSNKLAK